MLAGSVATNNFEWYLFVYPWEKKESTSEQLLGNC